MGRTGDDEIQGLIFLPEKLLPQFGIVKQQLLIIQELFLGFFTMLLYIVRVVHILVITHGQRIDTPGVEIGIVVVEHFGIIAFFRQLAGQGLSVVVGNIVKGIAALATEERAGIDTELRIEGPDAP